MAGGSGRVLCPRVSFQLPAAGHPLTKFNQNQITKIMNAIETEIEVLQKRIKEMEAKLDWLKAHRLDLAFVPNVSANTQLPIDFDQLSHAEVIAVIKALGGTWRKEINSSKTTIDYRATIDGQSVRCWSGQPPPSCKIVVVEEVVPAQPETKRKVAKLVCSDPELQAVEV